MPRKTKRSDSAHVENQILTDALKGIQPPDCVKLDKEHMPFWQHIINAREQWTTVDLIHAANLARCMASIEENQVLLKREGDVLENARGTPVMNPRFTILEQLSRRSVALSAKIQVHAAATIGESKLSKNKNTKKRESLEAMEDDDDGLIARPH